MALQHLNRLLVGLVALTVGALAWNQFGMQKVLVVDGSSPYLVSAIDDRSSQGRSISSLRREGRSLVLDCEIAKGYEWPYCELGITLRHPPAGLDFTGYDKVRVWARSEGPEAQHQLRLYLREFNPAYSKVGDELSLKVHELIYDPTRSPMPLEIGMNHFAVASWWKSGRAIPVEHSAPEFDNISALELTTGGNVVPGPHRVILDRVEFSGKWIPTATFRLGVIGAWLALVIGYLALETWRTRRALGATHRSLSSLRRINAALRVQSRSDARLARHDALTGVLNRKGLGDELLRLAQDRDDTLFPLSVVFVDLDHFKSVNDRHGHAVGDQVLQAAVNLVRDLIQRRDLFARWGGEEFVLLFPATALQEAALVAERLRHAIAIAHWPGGLRMTASFGVAEWTPGEELAEALERADQAMYQAKRSGRDRVELQRDPDELAA